MQVIEKENKSSNISKKVKVKEKNYKIGKDFRTQFELKLFLWPVVFLVILFDFIPLFGLSIAFTDYSPATGIKGIFTSEWNNFKNFIFMFDHYQFWNMVKNTIGINLLGQLISIPVTLGFALLLNEIMNRKFKSFVQTVTYMPHFLSWVIYGGLFITILNPTGGIVNTLLLKFNLVNDPIQFLGDPTYFWGIAIVTALLKDIGWGAILYLAAIAGVDHELYEAAAIDGAGRFRRIVHITIPSILPTVMILVIFAVSGMLNNNFTQIYVLQNSLNLPASEVIDTYLYRTGLLQFQFSEATAIGLMKAIFAVILLWGANALSKKITDHGLF